MDYTFDELVCNGQKALEAVALLHEQGYQGIRIKPGLSPSGAYWRLKIYNVFAPGVEYFRYGPQAPDKIWYIFEGKDREIQLARPDAEPAQEITSKDIADAILRVSSFGGERIVDDTYNLWYEKLMLHIAGHGGLPIAYADWDLEPGQWAMVGGDGSDFPEPPRGYPVPVPTTSWHSNLRAGNYLSATWALGRIAAKEKEVDHLKAITGELAEALAILGVDAIYAILKSTSKDEPMNWSRRYKYNQEKLATGNALLVAQVVRDLTRRKTDKGLSAGETRMLEKAKNILATEISRIESVTESESEAKVEAALSAIIRTESAGIDDSVVKYDGDN